MRRRILVLAMLCTATTIAAAQAEPLRVLGAGSLREVIGEVGVRYRTATGIEVSADFGPSGLVCERIENGEKADLFASADMGHALKLLAEGGATRVAMFTRNALCGFALPKIGLNEANFLDRLLDPAVKLGTSTPKADPSGDYTWVMFRTRRGYPSRRLFDARREGPEDCRWTDDSDDRQPGRRWADRRHDRRDDRLLQRTEADAGGRPRRADEPDPQGHRRGS